MTIFQILIGWTAVIVILEAVMWHIFYKKTVRICFLTEPDLLLSRYVTVGVLRIVVIIHASLLLGNVIFFYSLIW